MLDVNTKKFAPLNDDQNDIHGPLDENASDGEDDTVKDTEVALTTSEICQTISVGTLKKSLIKRWTLVWDEIKVANDLHDIIPARIGNGNLANNPTPFQQYRSSATVIMPETKDQGVKKDQSAPPPQPKDAHEHQEHHHGKDFAKRAGHAITFGAGATIGSDAVNGIIKNL
ncbi:SH3 domain-containing protein [Fusarium denticulatum]|uniref:SH3 domain-containing protein n=1 Tax=Fusarium denticulatum TaxID=48507 RepID=A0A8H5XJU5_9HYPO|nr:SH3 domain-containing protein [Fusarium denticulatum]